MATADEAGEWLRRADAACDEITDTELSSRALHRLADVYIQRGEIDRAIPLIPCIENHERSVQARIAMAAHYAKIEQDDECVEQLILANKYADAQNTRSDLIVAFLDLTHRPGLAISFLKRRESVSASEKEGLCEQLAERGYLDAALTLINGETDADAATKLLTKTAFASANAGRIDQTERAIALVDAQRTRQYAWMKLASALLKEKEFDDARKFADNVTDSSVRRAHQQTIKRIYSNNARDTRSGKELLERAMQHAPSKRSHHFGRALEQQTIEQDPDLANKTVAAMVANAKANPVEPSTGQFGPSNPEIQLASTLSHYARVAHLYHKAGNREEAAKKLRIAEDAIVDLVKQNAFVAWMGLLQLHPAQLAMNDIAGIKRTTTAIPAQLWAIHAEKLVEKLLAAGDLDAAVDVATRALAVKSPMGGSGKTQGSVIGLFIAAGKYQTTLDILKAIDPGAVSAQACEVSGQAMVTSGQGETLKAWSNDLAASQLVHLYIGAASGLR